MRELKPRKSERHPMEAEALVRNLTGRTEEAKLLNISVDGCSVSLRPDFLQAGDVIIIRMRNLESLTGRVRWVKGRQAGVLFQGPLHVAVAEHIARSNPKLECVRVA